MRYILLFTAVFYTFLGLSGTSKFKAAVPLKECMAIKADNLDLAEELPFSDEMNTGLPVDEPQDEQESSVQSPEIDHHECSLPQLIIESPQRHYQLMLVVNSPFNCSQYTFNPFSPPEFTV